MKLPQSLLVCLCLLGATHLALSQTKESGSHAIPGYLDPATGKFTTRTASAANATHPEATTAASDILFREDFKITITNYDQAGTTAVCSVTMSGGDNGYDYDEEASVAVSSSGGSFTCDVPVLASWSLQTPTTDMVYASISVSIYTPNSATGAFGTPTVYRSSNRSLTVSQPGNTQTVVQNISITL